MEEARFLDSYHRKSNPRPPGARLHGGDRMERDRSMTLTHAELGFGARLAWRQAERCVGRLYWKAWAVRSTGSEFS